MKKKKEYPEHYSEEIFNEFEKNSYNALACIKRHKISNTALLIAGTIIYALECFFSIWRNIIVSVSANFEGDISNNELALVFVLSPLFVFVLWLVVTIMINLILKVKIKSKEISDIIKSTRVLRMRTLMKDIENDWHEPYSLLDKKLIKPGDLFPGLSYAAAMPLIVSVFSLSIKFVIEIVKTKTFNSEYLIGMSVVSIASTVCMFISNLIFLRIINIINRKFANVKWDDDLYSHIKYEWWPEIDEERRKEVEANKIRAEARNKSFFSTIARVMAQEQRTSSSVGGLYGAPGCGEMHIDTRDY